MAHPSLPDAPAPRRSSFLLAAKLLLAVALIAVELQLLLWIAQPRVDEAYRRHFIDRTSGCWAPASFIGAVARAPQPRIIEPARLDKARVCAYLPDGWSLPEEHVGIWSIGRHAVIMAPFRPPARAIRLALATPGYLPAPQELVIRQGGSRLFSDKSEPREARSSSARIPRRSTGTASSGSTWRLPVR